MKHTKRSFALFALLALLVVFFLGLNLGKYVQRMDTTYVPTTPSPTPPSETPIPTAEPKSISYTSFNFRRCGVAFVVPSNLVQRTSNLDEAEFTAATGDRIFVTCNDSFIAQQEPELTSNTSTSSATLASQKVTLYATKKTQVWIIRNTARQRVLFEASTSIAPLVQETLELE
jgi:hypothetical protein